MKKKRFLSILLTCVMTVGSVFSGPIGAVSVKAAPPTIPAPIYTNTFEDTLGTATAWQVGSTAYTGPVEYAEGRTGGKSITLGGASNINQYGVKLNQNNLGDNFTVSMWYRPSGTSIAENSAVIFLGNHSPEKWIGLAGNSGTNRSCKFWGAGGPGLAGTTIGHTNFGTYTLANNAWSMLTITGKGDTVAFYVNGALVSESKGGLNALNGEGTDIYLGVNNWDQPPAIPVRYDDVSVYNQALTGLQVAYLYDPTIDPAVTLNADGITATATLGMRAGAKRQIDLTIPALVKLAEPTITYMSDTPSVATVDDKGLVTGIAAGTATVTSTVSLEGVSKSASTTVTVTPGAGVATEFVANYDLSGLVSGKLQDTSGYNNHANVQGATNIDFIQEDGVPVMDIKSGDGYVELPLSIMDSLTNQEEFSIEATYSRAAAAPAVTWLFCFGSIPRSTGRNYLFYCPSFQGGAPRAGIKNDSTEHLFRAVETQPAEQYYKVTQVFKNGVLTMFIDGIMIDTNTGAEEIDSGFSIMKDVVLSGTENGVLGFIGKSVWSLDGGFVGKLKGFKIYDKAMTPEEVQKSDPAYQAALQKKLDDGSQAWSIQGSRNPSLDDVRYNLALPGTLDALTVVWESSDPEVISDTGAVRGVSEDKTVTLTARITSAYLEASKSYQITVKPANRVSLEAAVVAAGNVERNLYTADSLEKLDTALETAKAATMQTAIDSAVTALNKAINDLVPNDTYMNPFDVLDTIAPVQAAQLKAGTSQTLFTLPAEMVGMVDIEYISANTSVATYTNGVLKGIKEGTTQVMMVVTSVYDASSVEYPTIVRVTKADPVKVVGLDKVTAKAKATRLAKGKKTQITVAYPATVKAAAPKVSYKASGAVSVNSKGRVTAKKAGTGKITVTVTVSTGEKVTRTITVRVGAITGKSSVKVGKDITLKQKGLTGKVKWSVNRKRLATISKKGRLRAKKKGTVTVTAKVGKVKITRKIKIKK